MPSMRVLGSSEKERYVGCGNGPGGGAGVADVGAILLERRVEGFPVQGARRVGARGEEQHEWVEEASNEHERSGANITNLELEVNLLGLKANFAEEASGQDEGTSRVQSPGQKVVRELDRNQKEEAMGTSSALCSRRCLPQRRWC